MSKRSKILLRKSLILGLMIVIVLVCLFPIYWLLLTSFQPKSELMTSPPHFYTSQPTLEHWKFTFRETLPKFFNSLVIISHRD